MSNYSLTIKMFCLMLLMLCSFGNAYGTELFIPDEPNKYCLVCRISNSTQSLKISVFPMHEVSPEILIEEIASNPLAIHVLYDALDINILVNFRQTGYATDRPLGPNYRADIPFFSPTRGRENPPVGIYYNPQSLRVTIPLNQIYESLQSKLQTRKLKSNTFFVHLDYLKQLWLDLEEPLGSTVPAAISSEGLNSAVITLEESATDGFYSKLPANLSIPLLDPQSIAQLKKNLEALKKLQNLTEIERRRGTEGLGGELAL